MIAFPNPHPVDICLESDSLFATTPGDFERSPGRSSCAQIFRWMDMP